MKILLILVLISVIAVPAMATNIPDPDMSYVIWAYEGTDPVTLLNFPDGGGASFVEVRDQAGTVFDGTITIVVLDHYGNPVPDFPREDIYLLSDDGGMVPCMGGTRPDENTDFNGMSHWINPLHACGNSLGFCEVMIMGTVVNHPPLALRFNSPDINGDGSVNLMDVGLFSIPFYGGYDFTADLHHDGVLNLADVSRLAQGSGVTCP
jgi:hypothetical protein